MFDGSTFVGVGPIVDIPYQRDSTGQPLRGVSGASTSNADQPRIAFMPNTSQLYIAYKDFANGNSVTVRMFDGLDYVTVGSAGFASGGAIDSLNLAFQPNTSQPYVAFQEMGTKKVSVMKFEGGSSWIQVGPPSFSAGPANRISLQFQPSTSIPFVAYENSTQVTVMSYDGSVWNTFGPPAGPAADQVNIMAYEKPTGFSFQPNSSAPFLAYSDLCKDKGSTVVTFP